MDAAVCETCGSVGLHKGGDGFHYCVACGSQSQNFVEEDLGDFVGLLGQDNAGKRTFAFVRQHNLERQAQEEQLRRLNDMLQGVENLDEKNIDDPAAVRAREEALMRALSQKEENDSVEQVRESLALQFVAAENVHIWSGPQRMYDASELPDRLADHIREYYVQGLQRIIQLQCEALVERFGVSPLICGVIGPIWLRFVASSRVFEKDWAGDAILLADAEKIKKGKLKGGKENESSHAPEAKRDHKNTRKKRKDKAAKKEEEEKKPKRSENVPHTPAGIKLSKVWTDSIKRRLPLRITLAIVFLACYVVREPVLPSDILSWAGEGSLPYLKVYLNFQSKRFAGPDLRVIHLSELDPKSLFRPSYLTSANMIELLAGHVANRLGLELPPVNFHALSRKLLEGLGVQEDQVMSYLERLYGWYTPEGLWLSARTLAFPSAAYVAAMVIVTLKVLYDVDGHAQSSLYWPNFKQRHKGRSTRRATFQDVLDNIEKRLLDDAIKPEADLKDYLNYCQENIFAGSTVSPDEEVLYDHLWKYFDKLSQKVVEDPIHEEQHEDTTATRPKVTHSSENEEHTLGSGKWSRAPSAQKQEQGSRDLAGVNLKQESEEEKVILDPVELEVSSENRETQDLQRAKNKLLNSISHQLRVCGFKLVPSRLSGESAAQNTYAIFPTTDYYRHSPLYVYGDYFILLYACSRVMRVKPKVIHKCVQTIEAELWQLEKRVERLTSKNEAN